MYDTYSSYTVTTLTPTCRHVGDYNNTTIVIALATVGTTAFLCCIIAVICVCAKSRAKRRTERVTQTGVQGPPIRRSITPVATAVGNRSENSNVDVPVATATAIQRMATVDASMTLPPASVADMETLPVAVAAVVVSTPNPTD